MRNWIVNFIVIGLASAFLWHFACLILYGAVLISEPNQIMLYTEIGFLFGCIIFSILNLIKMVW